MLLQMAGFNSFLWLNSIRVCVCVCVRNIFIHSSTDGHLDNSILKEGAFFSCHGVLQAF